MLKQFKRPVSKLNVGGLNRAIYIKLLSTRCFTKTKQNLSAYPEAVRLAYKSVDAARPWERTATPIIIMHGLFGSKNNWGPIATNIHKRLRPQRKIIAVDLRNHGDSPHTEEGSNEHMADDIANLMAHMKMSSATIMGHSLGGRAAMMTALKYPDLVSNLIVCDISPFANSPGFPMMVAVLQAMQNVKLHKDMGMSQIRRHVEKELEKTVPGKWFRSVLVTNIVKREKGYRWRLNLPTLIKCFEEDAFDFSAETQRLKYNGPTLFVKGGDSEHMPTNHLPELRKMFPNAELETIKDAGHMMHLDSQKEFMEVLVKFLNNNK